MRTSVFKDFLCLIGEYRAKCIRTGRSTYPWGTKTTVDLGLIVCWVESTGRRLKNMPLDEVEKLVVRERKRSRGPYT